MKGKKKGGVKKKLRPSGSSKSKKAGIAAAKKAAADSQKGGDSGGNQMTKADAIAAVSAMGIPVNAKGKVDTVAARKVAEGAAVSAAAAMGVNIMKADGTIDTNKAREAVAGVLGFSIEKDGAGQQAEAAAIVQQAVINSAKEMGADITNADGDIDVKKARQVADLALSFSKEQKGKLDRGEAMEALDANLKTLMTFSKISRREAAATMEKLLNASVIENGGISARKALAAREAAIAQAIGENKSVWIKGRVTKQTARQNLNTVVEQRALLGKHRTK